MPAPPAYAVLIAIRRIVRAVSLHSRHLGRASGLTVPQLLTLKAVGDAGPDGTTASAILDAVGVSPGTLSGIVQRLVDAGQLARARDPRDRRRVVLRLSDTGRATLDDAPRPLQERFLERLSALPDSERDALLDALERIVDMMEAGDLDASPILISDAVLSHAIAAETDDPAD